MFCEDTIHINTNHFNERLKNKNLTLFDIFAYLYPQEAKNCETKTDKNAAVRKIRKWQDGTAMPKTVNDLLALCELFDCDVEYLIGKQEFVRKDNANATTRTGLKEITIEEIAELSLTEKHIIDALFSRSAGSFHLFKLIKEMLFYLHPNAEKNASISLDSDLALRDKDIEELEKKLNDTEILNLLSYRLGLEMQNILETLSRDNVLANEIYEEYKKKYFTSHLKIREVDDLPKFDGEKLVFTIEEQIENLERKILDRLIERERLSYDFQYPFDWLYSKESYKTAILEKREELESEDYLKWLEDIEEKTR